MTESAKNVSRDSGIDMLKTLSAFLVVIIHTNKQLMASNIDIAHALVAFARLGVGCFFVITGYYFPLLVDRGRFKGHLLKILKVALWSMLLYLMFNLVYYQVVWHDFMIPITKCMDGDNLIDFIFWNACPVDIHLWYLFAIGYATVFCWLFYRYDKTKALYGIALVLLVCGIAWGWFGDYSMQRNWLFYGVPFVAGGILMREKISFFKGVKSWILALILCMALSVNIVEAIALGVNRDFYLFSIVAAISMMALAVKSGEVIDRIDNSVVGFLCMVGLKYSMYIYIFHIAVKRTLDFALSHVGIDPAIFHVGYSVIIFALSLIVSVLWVKIPHRPF